MISHFGRVEFCVTLWTERVQGGSVGKESACNTGAARGMSSIPESGRSPGGGHGNPL